MDIAFTHASVIGEQDILSDGAVLVRQGVVAWMGPTDQLPATGAEIIDLGGFFLAPGLIDIHVHGAAGLDASSCDVSGLKTICRTHEATGTTSLCLTVLPSPPGQLRTALANIQQIASEGSGGARVLGAYLEGPFVNPTRVDAAQERWIVEPELAALKALAVAAGGWLRIVTLAPELPGTEELIQWLAHDMGLVAAIGHTSATCEQTQQAIAGGVKLASHLFNGMKPFHHRDPNAAGAVLAAEATFAELILDGVHLHPTAAAMAYRCLGPDRMVLVTDATSIVGATDGRGEVGGRPIHYEAGAARFDDGQIAGSALTMIDAVRYAIDKLGLSYAEAIRCASLTPAELLGIDDRLGSIQVGKHADLLVLDRSDLRVLYSYVGGRRIFRSPY